MYTGVGDMDKLGTIRRWENQESTKFWRNSKNGGPSMCNMINGTDATIFAPRAPKESLYIYATDICRYWNGLHFEYSNLERKNSFEPNLLHQFHFTVQCEFNTKRMSFMRVFQPIVTKRAMIFYVILGQNMEMNAIAWTELSIFQADRMVACTEVPWIYRLAKVSLMYCKLCEFVFEYIRTVANINNRAYCISSGK